MVTEAHTTINIEYTNEEAAIVQRCAR